MDKNLNSRPQANPWLLLLLSISLPALRLATERLLGVLEAKVQDSPALSGALFGPLASPPPIERSSLSDEDRQRLQEHLDRS